MSRKPPAAPRRSADTSPTVANLLEAMDRIAPLELAEPWDNVGLILGDARRALDGPVLLTIDLSEAVATEAVHQCCSAVVAYHPPVFHPIKKIGTRTSTERVILKLLGAGAGAGGDAGGGVCVLSPHTALDAAKGGLTDWLADGLLGLGDKGLASSWSTRSGKSGAGTNAVGASGAGGGDRRALRPSARRMPTQEVKIVTFVPPDAVERVRAGLASAGAGLIGNYELCSFTTGGHGSFLGKEGSNPVVGRAGRLESAPEIRLEMVCSKRALGLAMEMIRQFHPYEEPAVDVYELVPPPDRAVGAGRRIAFDHPVSLAELAKRLRKHMGGEPVLIAPRESEKRADPASIMISRAAVVPGAGGELAPLAAEDGCEVFVTGEMKHHEIRAAVSGGMSVLLGGHTQTERGYLKLLARRLEAELSAEISDDSAGGAGKAKPPVSVLVSTEDRAPTLLMD